MKTLVLEILARTLRKERGVLGHYATRPITLTRTTTNNAKKLGQPHACHASRGSARTQPNVVNGENYVLEGEEPVVRPTENLRETHMGRETKKFRDVLG